MCIALQGQNLVPNPSFEDKHMCPRGSAGITSGIVAHWFSPTAGSSDYFHGCSSFYTAAIPENFAGFQYPRNRDAMAGLILHKGGTGIRLREYMSVKLKKPLKPSQSYIVSFWVSLANDASNYGISKIGAYFSDHDISIPTADTLWRTPQIMSPPGVYITDTANWVEIKSTFQASGAEEYMTLGNFNGRTGKTPIKPTPIPIPPDTVAPHAEWAYYYFDAIAVYEYDTLVRDTICFGDSILIGGSWVTDSGTYHSSILGYPVKHVVTQLPWSRSFVRIDTSICNGDSLIVNGNAYTTDGVYLDTLTSSRGCDSVVSIHITFTGTHIVIDTAICDGDTLFGIGNPKHTAGTHRDTLSDASGCPIFVRTELQLLSASSTMIDTAICDGDILVTAGTAKSSTGIYSDTLVNHRGCDSIVTTNLVVRDHSRTVIDTSVCPGTIVVTGGIPKTIAGTYHDTLVNSGNCDSVIVTTIIILPTSFTAIDTGICSGETITTGGSSKTITGIYWDTLTNNAGCDSVIRTDLTVYNQRRSSQGTTICARDSVFIFGEWTNTSGMYSDTFIDSRGCDSISTINLTVLPSLSATVMPFDVDCYGEQSGSVTISALGGVPGFTYTLTSSSGSETELSGTFDSLPAGMYSGFVTDDFGCQEAFAFTITQPDSLFASVSSTDATCFAAANGALAVNGIAGGIPPYETFVNGSVLNSPAEQLPAGSYDVRIIDANGCILNHTVVIDQPDPMEVTVTPDTLYGKPGELFTVSLSHNADPGMAQYHWTPAQGLSCTDCAEPEISLYQSSVYTVRVADLSDPDVDCFADGYLVVVIDELKNVFIPNAFTPNGDGYNDVFSIFGDHFFEAEMQIFNRWGELVHYEKSASPQWDGTYFGEIQHPGVFVYTLQITYIDGSQRDYKGSISLIR